LTFISPLGVYDAGIGLATSFCGPPSRCGGSFSIRWGCGRQVRVARHVGCGLVAFTVFHMSCWDALLSCSSVLLMRGCWVGVGVLKAEGEGAPGGKWCVKRVIKARSETRRKSCLISRRTWASHFLGLPYCFSPPHPSVDRYRNGPHPSGEGRGASEWVAVVGSELGGWGVKVVVVGEGR